MPAGYQERFATAYVRELQEFVAGIAAGEGVSGASAWDGYAATVACEAAVASLHRGEAVDIRLEPKPGALRAGAHAGALSHPSTLRLTRAGCS